MSSAHEINVVLFAEFFHNIFAENEGDASLVFAPTIDIVRICPEEIAQNTSIWNILWSHDGVDLGEVLELWRKTSVHTKDSLVYDR